MSNCPVCGAEVEQTGRGPRRIYCSPAHANRAHQRAWYYRHLDKAREINRRKAAARKAAIQKGET